MCKHHRSEISLVVIDVPIAVQQQFAPDMIWAEASVPLKCKRGMEKPSSLQACQQFESFTDIKTSKLLPLGTQEVQDNHCM
jgi:hypothetical protein